MSISNWVTNRAGAKAASKRVLGIAWPFLLAVVIVLPVLPSSWVGGASVALGRALRVVSVGNRWVMYAHPSRIQRQIRIEAEFEGGFQTEVPLPDRSGPWDRDRRVLWEALVSKKGSGNPNLRWFLRGQCVRARQLGMGSPKRVTVIRRVRRLRSPDAVRRGRDVWGPWRESVVISERCIQQPRSP